MDSQSTGKADYGELMKIANSPDGQKLLKLVQQHGGDSLGDAMQQAQEGDYSRVKDMLLQILSGSDAQELIRRIRGGT